MKYVNNFTAPNVEIHCVYSTGLPTPELLNYKKSDDFSVDPEVVYGEGDGTVNLKSLTGCTYWRKFQKKPIVTYEVKDAEHLALLGHPLAVDYVVKVLTEN
jgi:lysophospholipase-3